MWAWQNNEDMKHIVAQTQWKIAGRSIILQKHFPDQTMFLDQHIRWEEWKMKKNAFLVCYYQMNISKINWKEWKVKSEKRQRIKCQERFLRNINTLWSSIFGYETFDLLNETRNSWGIVKSKNGDNKVNIILIQLWNTLWYLKITYPK